MKFEATFHDAHSSAIQEVVVLTRLCFWSMLKLSLQLFPEM